MAIYYSRKADSWQITSMGSATELLGDGCLRDAGLCVMSLSYIDATGEDYSTSLQRQTCAIALFELLSAPCCSERSRSTRNSW